MARESMRTVSRPRGRVSRAGMLLVAGVLVAGAFYAWILGAFITDHARLMEQDRISQLSKMTQMARMILDPVVERVSRGESSVDQGRSEAVEILRPVRFEDQSVVMFLIANDGTVFLQSQAPEQEGVNQWFAWDAEDGYLLRELVLAVHTDPEGGYITYTGASSAGDPVKESRTAYVLAVPELSLVIGTALDLRTMRAHDQFFSRQAGLLGALMFVLVALPLAVALLMLRSRNRELEHESSMRKRVEEVMLEGEQRYRSLFDNAPVGICQTTMDGRVLRANPTLAVRLGYGSAMELLEAKLDFSASFYVHKEDREELLQELRAHGQVREMEALVQDRDGERFWATITARLVRGRDGEPRHIENLIMDIDDRKRAEEELRISEERYRVVSLQPDQLVWELELDTDTVVTRGDVATVLGFEPGAEGLDRLDFWLDHVHPEDVDGVRAQMERSAERGDSFYREYRFRRGDGEYIFLEKRGVALRNEWGAIYRLLGTIRDISPRKQAELGLERSEAKYRTLFESAADALFVIEGGVIVDCNPATEELFGLGRDKVIGRSPNDLSPETQPDGQNSAELVAEYLAAALDGKPQRFTWIHRRGDGSDLYTHISLARFGSEDKYRILAVIHDMSERWLAEEQRMRFENIASASSDHMAFTDMDLVYQVANQAYAEAVGTTPDAIVGRTVPEVFGPRAWAEVRDHVERAQGGEVVTYSQWLELSGAGRRYFEAVYSPYFDSSGRQTGIVINRHDITGRKRIQDALLESERRYRLLAENAADVIWTADANLRLTYISPAVTGFSGLTPEEVLQRPAEDFFTRRSWVEIEGALRGLQKESDRLEKSRGKGGEPPTPVSARRLEISFEHKDGRVLWADVLVTAIRDEHGRLEGFHGVTRDVTERKQTREALARSLRFEKVVDLCAKKLLASASGENVLAGVLEEIRRTASLDRVFVLLNNEDGEGGLSARLAYEALSAEYESDADDPALQGLAYDTDLPHFRDLFAAGKGMGGLVKNLPQPERGVLEAHRVRSMLAQPLMVAGNWFGFMGFHDLERERVWDQSERLFLETTAEMVGAYFERLHGEENLRQAYTELDQIFNSAGNGMVLFDLEGRVRRVNRPMLEMFGLTTDQVLGKKCYEILPLDCRNERGCPCRINDLDSAPEGYDFSFEDPDKGTRSISVLISPFLDARGVLAGSVVSYRDITRRVRAQESAERRQEQLVQADKLASLGTLVSGVAHEINNPNGIISLTAPTLAAIWQGVKPMLEERFAEQGDFKVGEFFYSRVRDEVDYLFEQVVESGRRIKRIVAELKDFARQDAADMNQEVDLAEVLQAAVGLVGNKLKKATTRFKFSLPRGPVMVLGNFQRLEQVVVNVLINACEALTSTDQPIEAVLTRDEKAGLAELRVTDQGAGIAEEDLKHIFDPFFTTKRDQGGTGLGLSVSHGIVLEHGGSMKYRSVEGEGTTVIVRLALLGVEPTPDTPPEEPEE